MNLAKKKKKKRKKKNPRGRKLVTDLKKCDLYVIFKEMSNANVGDTEI
jgi:FMN-dependent NADH-azoreductase